MSKRYIIQYFTFNGRVLTFHISNYKEEGNFIEFIDEKTGIKKKFPAARCEISEVSNA